MPCDDLRKAYIQLLLDGQVVNLSGGRSLLAALWPESRAEVDSVREDTFPSGQLQLSCWMLMLHSIGEDRRAERLE